MAKSKKCKTPSRIRYEQRHPTISFRVSKELYERLQKAKQTEGKSYTDVIKRGLGLIEVKIGKEKDIHEKAYREGHRNGYTLAESNYKITVPCAECGEEMEVRDEHVKRAIKKYLVENEWRHADCSSY